MSRIDVHRPSAIEPADYEFVAFSYLKVEDLGSAMFLQEERRRLRAHMERTGGKYSSHEHGGNCAICGSPNAIYTAAFWHKPSNRYLKTGLDCAQKLECEGVEAFRKKVTSALEANKGKRKAKALLEKLGFGKAWELREADAKKRAEFAEECKAWREANPEPEYKSSNGGYGVEEVGVPRFKSWSKNEEVVLDMVERLIKFGSISDKAERYLGVLLDRIEKAPQIAAERAAEADAALPVPVVKGRVAVRGKVLSIKPQGEFDYGPKMLIQHKDGWRLWGSVPSALRAEIERGDEVEFMAVIRPSDKDPKFGFISRPSKPRLYKALAA